MSTCTGSVDNRGVCSLGGSCAAADEAQRYRRAMADRRGVPNAWAVLLDAHGDRFLGVCPGSARADEDRPCDRGDGCAAVWELAALRRAEQEGERGGGAWVTFVAAHGGRMHFTGGRSHVGIAGNQS